MNRRKLLGAFAGFGATLGVRRSVSADAGCWFTDHAEAGDPTRIWSVPGGILGNFTASTRDGANVPTGGSITVWVSVNGGTHYNATIAAGARYATGAVPAISVASSDVIRWGATFSGMSAVALNLALVVG